MPTIDECVKKYVELRDRQAQIAERHKEELAPISEAMGVIEAFFMSQMNATGTESFKTQYGTAFKKNANSVKMVDAQIFKEHVFQPAVEAIINYLGAVGYDLQPADSAALKEALQTKVKWDMVDFRAGKKGILEYLEDTSQLPPGVSVETVSVVQVRRV